MKLVYFASVRQRLSRSEEELVRPADIVTVRDLARHLRERGGAYETVFADERGLRVAIDQEHAGWDADITAALEIAFFPPVTGG